MLKVQVEFFFPGSFKQGGDYVQATTLQLAANTIE